jgi:predicted NBD/HSP70 family sugar kinase
MPFVSDNPTERATNRTPREINRKLLMSLLAERGVSSRAELSRLSGLQRSTVSLIVEELIGTKQILEEREKFQRVAPGRRPINLRLNLKQSILAIDLASDEATIGVAEADGRIVGWNRLLLSSVPSESADRIANSICTLKRISRERTFNGIGISVRARREISTSLPTSPSQSRQVVSLLKERLLALMPVKIEIDNVANACALAEFVFGESDRGVDRVVIDVSDMISVGILASGHLLRGSKGMAGKFGHEHFDLSESRCDCALDDCWEVLGSIRATLQFYARLSSQPDGNIQFADLVRLAHRGDQFAMQALEQAAHHLNRGVRAIVSLLAPAEITIMGPIVSAWDVVGPILRSGSGHKARLSGTIVRHSVDSPETRLRGAAALLLAEYRRPQLPGRDSPS